MSVKYGPLLGTKPLDRSLEEAEASGALHLSGRNLRNLSCCEDYDITDVTEADLSRNRFTEIPSELCACSSLETLVCHHNAIKTIPEEIGQLRQLTHLDCSRNQLFSIPSSLCSLALETLILRNNRLTVLPPEVGNLKRLLELDVSNNDLRHLPSSVGEMKRLRTLKLRRNHVSELPDGLWQLKLVHLDLTSNLLKVLPTSLTKLSISLCVLEIDNNPLESPPSEVCARGLFHVLKYLTRKTEEQMRPNRSNSSRRSRTADLRLSRRHNEGLPQSSTLNSARHSISLAVELERAEKKIAEKHGLGLEWPKQLPDIPSLQNFTKPAISEPIFQVSAAASVPVVATSGSQAAKLSSSTAGASQPAVTSSSSPRVRAYGTLPNESKRKVANGGSRIQTSDKKGSQAQEAASTSDNSSATSRLTATQMAKSLQKRATGRSSPTKRESPTRRDSPKRRDSPTAFEFDKRRSVPATLPSAATDGPSESSQKEESHGQEEIRKLKEQETKQNKQLKRSALPETEKETSPDAENREKARENERRVMETRIAWEKREKATQPASAASRSLSEVAAPKGSNTASLRHKPSDPGPQRPDYTSKSLPKPAKSKASSFKGFTGKFTVKRTEQNVYDSIQRQENLRRTLEMRLETQLPDDLMEALSDGVILCNFVNRVHPKTVTTIYTSRDGASLSSVKAHKNIDSFLGGCKKLGVPPKKVCSRADISEHREPLKLCQTVESLVGLIDKETEI